VVAGAEQSGTEQWAKQAIERLNRDKLAPTPDNYAVLYYYFAGTNPNLKAAVDALLKNGLVLTQDQCTELFQAHLGIDAEHRMLKETNAAIDSEIKRVLSAIDQAAVGATQFSKSLDSFSGELKPSATLEQIRNAVTKVVTETRTISQQNERLASQLSSATQQLSDMRQNLDQVHKESQIDGLTEVGNRKFFDHELVHSMAEARDNGWPLTLLMIDIDHFKKFNDSYGHLIGDQVLRLVAHTLVENLKGRDIIARYGGEEFVILLPQTRVTDAEKVANQLRAGLSTKQIKRRSTNETLGVITISLGAAEYYPGEDNDSFVGRADAALYRAKQTGRNKVMLDILTPEQMAEMDAKAPPKLGAIQA
jgi:diguanylate cyclase